MTDPQFDLFSAAGRGPPPAASRVVRRVRVLLPEALPEPFDYALPDDLEVVPGDLVEVPLGNRVMVGAVWERADGPSSLKKPLKPVRARIDAPPVPERLRALIDWAAPYLCAPKGLLLRMVLRSPEGFAEIREETVFLPTGLRPPRMSAAREQVLAAANAVPEAPLTAAGLAEAAGVSAGVVQGLAAAGALRPIRRPVDPPFLPPDPDFVRRDFSPDQRAAADHLTKAVDAAGFAPVLLDGVTGSGKTEVYFEAIAAQLRAPDAQILVLLPEIALTRDVLARFESRFGARPAEWHSGITGRARRRAWREIAAGRARIVVGARSALFLPYRNLRLIVVDEEHDQSFKQDEVLHYQARDLAIMRSKLENGVIVLASATPSLETLHNATSGRFAHLRLPARAGAAALPAITLVDMRADPPEKGRWLSPKLVEATAETLARGEQVLLFLNRRGYAPLVVCRACGGRLKAPDSDSWLVEHRFSGRLVCHLTGFSMPKPRFCPTCKAPDPFMGIGPGVERIFEEAKALFPAARVAIFSSDTALSPGESETLIADMKAGAIDILIGTQIAAKGHNFPMLTLVGVVDADMSLKGGDLRAGERTFQLLSQVAGRAGRAERPGRALLQTFSPDHDAMQALVAGDRDGFLAEELAMRRTAGLPPFGRLAALILSAGSEPEVESAAVLFAQAIPQAAGVDVWGPAIPPLAMIRGAHRRRFLARSDRKTDLSAFMSAWRSRVKIKSSWRAVIDIEPYSFM